MPRKQKSSKSLPEAQPSVDVPVFLAAPESGLSEAQVAERVAAGLDNRPVEPPRKTAGQIVKENVFTYFNMLFFLLALCVIAVGQWLNLTFMGVVFCNTIIGTRVTSIDELNRVKNQFTAGDSITLTLYNGGSYRDVAVILIDQATGQ